MRHGTILGGLVVAGCLLNGAFARAQETERLLVLPPKGWTAAYHHQQGNVDVTEVIPPDQNIQSWQDMLVVEMIVAKPDKDVQTVLADRVTEIRGDCANVGSGDTQLGKENGYDVGLRAIACPRSTKWDKGEVSLFKVLLGNARTYIVSRSWRSEPFEKQHVALPADKMTEWIGFMSQVVLCDTQDPAHPCPAKK
jgi:hypothetical protein